MKQRLKIVGIYAIYWIVFFLIARLLFMLYQYSFSFDIRIKEWFLAFFYGLRLDISATGYILAVVSLILLFTSFFSGKILNWILKPFTIIALSICSGIIVSDFELYKNWGFRMDSTPLLYLTKPKEALASTELWLSIVLFALTFGLVLLGNYAYNRFLKQEIKNLKKANYFSIPVFLVLTGTMILPIRGGVGIAPMNTGMVYFSENKFSNHAAINVVWNVMHSLVNGKNKEKSYTFMDFAMAEKIVQDLNTDNGNITQVLNSRQPNIVFIILESFSSQVVGALKGNWNATPHFNKLANEGLLFTNFYANGDRSDKGLVSILSGYPAQPTTSIMKSPIKTQSLPSLFNDFNKLGYESAFYYGGDIDFANMRSYFLNAKAQYTISDEDFNRSELSSKWGAHDEHLFNRLYQEIRDSKNSFFKVAFTLSSHDPFDVPMKPVFEGTDRDIQFLNSVYYTDSCLGVFMEKVKKLESWNNSLYVLVADHGSNRPGNLQNHELDKFKIPMLWIGGALRDSIKEFDKVGSQIDIPATILNQLFVTTNDYLFSKNLFSEGYTDFAFYAFNDGFAFIADTTAVIFDNIGNQQLFNRSAGDIELNKGKAYLQVLMNDYLNR